MKRVSNMFDSAFHTMKTRGWEKIYVAIDIHETILKPTWTELRSNEYYPFAKETLQLMSQMPEIYLIQWSSSSVENNAFYKLEFDADGIKFDHINGNPEVPSTDYADFDSKFYMNVLLDDKGGFQPNVDWEELYLYLKAFKLLKERTADPRVVIKAADEFVDYIKTHSNQFKGN